MANWPEDWELEARKHQANLDNPVREVVPHDEQFDSEGNLVLHDDSLCSRADDQRAEAKKKKG
jgi:hypothetical protein|tara:strand:- start:866 stop:1054 length:189 start_codon:yes stop_codon:yes gene_type:complete